MIKKNLFKKTRTLLTAVAVSAMGMATLSNPVTVKADVVYNPNSNEWVTTNGVDFTGLDSNENGWWYIENGIVNFDYAGIKPNDFGWWKIDGGKVNFDFTGLASNEYGWWYLENGKVNFDYTGIKPNEYGWWKVTNGAVDFTYTGIAQNEYGWFYLKDGYVDFNYTGVCANEFGVWYVENGGIAFNYNGVAEYNGTYYDVVNSQLVGAASDVVVEEQKPVEETTVKVEKPAVPEGYQYINWGHIPELGADKYDFYGAIDTTKGVNHYFDFATTDNIVVKKAITYCLDHPDEISGIDILVFDADENGNIIDDYYYDTSFGPVYTNINCLSEGWLGDIMINSTTYSEDCAYKSGNIYNNSNVNLKDYGDVVSFYWVREYL